MADTARYWAMLNAANTRVAASGLMLFAATSARACACQPGLEAASARSETFSAASPSVAPLVIDGGAVLGSEHAAAMTAAMASANGHDLL
jgi:hypothetical protein